MNAISDLSSGKLGMAQYVGKSSFRSWESWESLPDREVYWAEFRCAGRSNDSVVFL